MAIGYHGELLWIAAFLVENIQVEAPGEEKGAGDATFVYAPHDSGRPRRRVFQPRRRLFSASRVGREVPFQICQVAKPIWQVAWKILAREDSQASPLHRAEWLQPPEDALL